MKKLWWCVAVVGALGAVACDNRMTKQLVPVADVVDDMGNPRAGIDFGSVQINTTSTEPLLLRNTGSATLVVSKIELTSPLFAVASMLPFEVGTGVTEPLKFTFRPTEPDQRITGKATLTTDDPNKPTITIDLAGTGVAAVAVPMPSRIDFGEVYRTESGMQTFRLTNAGSNDLIIQDAVLESVGSDVSGDTQALKRTLKGGEQASAVFRFNPMSQGEVDGGLKLTFGNEVGTLVIPVRGRGVESVPRLCFKFDDSPMEQCTVRGMDLLDVRMGALCDNRLYPLDGGQRCLDVDGGVVASSRRGTMYLRNEGNTPVGYTMNFNLLRGGRCDAGSVIDFDFSNARDGGVWTETTVRLPTAITAPRPWETAPIAVTYRPSSNCLQDAADQAQIIWTKQGEPATRPPPSLFLTLTGESRLPRGVPQDVSLQGSIPTQVAFLGAGNAGPAPLTLTGVELFQTDELPDGGRSAEPTLACVLAAPGQDCSFFSWAPGQDPTVNVTATTPVNLPPSVVGPTTRTIGQLVFGADGGPEPQANVTYTIYAIIHTNDPYSPTVRSRIQARRQ